MQWVEQQERRLHWRQVAVLLMYFEEDRAKLRETEHMEETSAVLLTTVGGEQEGLGIVRRIPQVPPEWTLRPLVRWLATVVEKADLLAAYHII